MASVELRPATLQDFQRLLGVSVPFIRSRALSAIVDGRVIGVGGLAFAPDGNVVAFTELTDEARKYPVSMHRAAKIVMGWAREMKLHHVSAMALSDDMERAEKWLERLEFEPVDCGGVKIYQWHS